MTRWHQPWLWLLVQAALLWGVFHLRGQTTLLNVSGDSDLYVIIAGEPLFREPALRRMVPPGYPLFLQGVRASELVLRRLAPRFLQGEFAPDLATLPLYHFHVHVLAVLVFYAGVSRVVRSRWLALALASCLLYGNLILTQVHYLMSDAVGSSAAVAAIGFLLRIVARPRRWGSWLGLTVCLFAAYMVRPAYLFLVPLAPLLGVVLAGLVLPRPEWLARRLRLGAGLAAVAFLPFLAYSTLRYAVVGHFGVASSGGLNLLGVVGDLLTEDMVPALPERLRSRAARALAADKELPPLPPARHASWDRSVLETFVLQHWDRSEWYQGQMQYLGGIMQEVLYDHNLHNRVVFLLHMPPVVEELQQEGDHTSGELSADRKLGEMAGAILRARPGGYLKGVARRFWHAVVLVLANNILMAVLLLALAVSAGVERGVAVVRRLRGGADPPSVAPNYTAERNVVFVLAVSFALAKIVLMILVVPPVPRYSDAAGVFLPLAVMVTIFGVWRRVFAAI